MRERRYAALRAEPGRVLSGVAITYGETARIPGVGLERFEAGAFAPLGDVRLDVQHVRSRIVARTGAGLDLQDGSAALAVRAVLPETREAEDAHRLVSTGVLRGLSIEFTPRKERRAAGVRVVSRADLEAVSIVDTPAYPSSIVEPRRAGSFLGTLRGVVRFDRRVSCACAGGGCDSARFGRRSLNRLLDDGDGEDVLAAAGSYSGAFAARSNGTLRFRKTRAAMHIEADVPDNEIGRMVADQVEATGVLARPYVRSPETAGRKVGTTREYDDPVDVGSIIVGPSDRTAGWEPATLEDFEQIFDVDQEAVEAFSPRRRRWLYL